MIEARKGLNNKTLKRGFYLNSIFKEIIYFFFFGIAAISSFSFLIKSSFNLI